MQKGEFMERVKKILKWVIFLFVLVIILIITFMPDVVVEGGSADFNETEYKQQYAIAIKKYEKDNPVKVKKEEKAKKVARAYASKALLSLETTLKIKRFNVVLANFTFKNESDGEITDVEIRCSYYSPTNAPLGKNKKVLYVKVPKHGVKKVTGFKMGIAPSQASNGHCEVLSYLFDGVRVWY